MGDDAMVKNRVKDGAEVCCWGGDDAIIPNSLIRNSVMRRRHRHNHIIAYFDMACAGTATSCCCTQ